MNELTKLGLSGGTLKNESTGGKKENNLLTDRKDSFKEQTSVEKLPTKKDMEQLCLNGPGKKLTGSNASCGETKPKPCNVFIGSNALCGHAKPKPDNSLISSNPSCGFPKPQPKPKPSKPTCG